MFSMTHIPVFGGLITVPTPDTFFRTYFGRNEVEVSVKTTKEKFRDIYRKIHERIINDKQIFEPISLATKEEFTAFLVKEMQAAFKEVNQPYDNRKVENNVMPGVCYKVESLYKHDSSIEAFTANEQFWKVLDGCVFQIADGCCPSDALRAWFEGPTVGDCGTVLLACMLRALCKILGTKKFDLLFNTPLTKFAITQIIFEKPTYIEKYSESGDLNLNKKNKIYYGNPFHYLFDDIMPPTENTIGKENIKLEKNKDIKIENFVTENKNLKLEPSTKSKIEIEKNVKIRKDKDVKTGDFVYVKGVKLYGTKYPEGAFNGENLLCVGQNKNGENVYIGFDVKDFQEPKTYKEIEKILIEAYNEKKLNNISGTRVFLELIRRKASNEEYASKGACKKLVGNKVVTEECLVYNVNTNEINNNEDLKLLNQQLKKNFTPKNEQLEKFLLQITEIFKKALKDKNITICVKSDHDNSFAVVTEIIVDKNNLPTAKIVIVIGESGIINVLGLENEKEEETKKNCCPLDIYKSLSKETLLEELNKEANSIVGITRVARLNFDKFKRFVEEKTNSINSAWHAPSRDMSLKPESNYPQTTRSFFTKKNINEKSIKTPLQIKNNSFVSTLYKPSTIAGKKELEIAEKFAFALVNTQGKRDRGPIGLVFNNKSELGKTNFIPAIENYAKQFGLKVVVDKKIIAKLNQEQPVDKDLSLKALQEKLDQYINNVDLIIFDDADCKSELGIACLKYAIKYVIEKNKSILIKSDNDFDFNHYAPEYIGYDNKFVDNFYVMQNNENEKKLSDEPTDTKKLFIA